jgi:hypothetical protein
MKQLLVLGLVIMLACNNHQEEPENTNSSIIRIDVPLEELGSHNYVKSAKYIFLDQAYLIGRIGRVLFFNNKIYIHDEMTGRIAVFSDEGNYLFRIDNKGKGSMEYLKLTDFTIDKENNDLLIFDEMTHKIITFSLSKNKFVQEKKIDFYPTAFACEADYLYFFNPYTINYPRKKKYHYSLIRTNPKLKDEKRYFDIDENMGSFMSNPNRKGFFYGNNLYFRNRFENVIYKLNKGNVDTHCEIVFNENKDYKHALKDAIAKGTRDTERYHKCAKDIQDYCENDAFITFKYSREKRQYSVIYSKDADSVIYNRSRFRTITPESMKNGIPFIKFPSYSSNDIFVSLLTNRLMMHYVNDKNFMQSLEENLNDSGLIEKIKKFDANSNPVLALYEFKKK